MRHLDVHPEDASTELDPSPEQLKRLNDYLVLEIEDALAARYQQDQNWSECLRQYEGVPKNPTRNIPIENAPNIEVTLGAIACDAIYAQAIDLIFNQVTPLITAQATRGDKVLVADVKRLQTWLEICARGEWRARDATNHTALDWAQLGTGVFYIPWQETTTKTKVYKVEEMGATILSHPIEDLIVPGGAQDDIQRMPWVSMRFFLTESEVTERARRFGWDADRLKGLGGFSWLRTRREQLGRTSRPKTAILYEIHDVYCHFDIDEDGLDEDLLVTWDRTAKYVCKVRYNPYDKRPIEPPRYQMRGHLFYALGVLEMLKSYQDELTEVHCDTLTNSRLANTRMWKGRPNAVPGGVVRVFPNKYIETPEPDGFGEVTLSDVYPSAYRNEGAIVAYAERRVGVRELSGPSPSHVLGGRTPGITALSVLQQTNQRFAPAFDDLRARLAAAIRQCVWRYREQLLAGNERAADNIRDMLGHDDGERIIALLKSPRFEESISVELTATSASLSKAQDRQDAMLLVNILVQYYEKSIQLMTIASNPQTPPPVVEVAKQIAEKIGEVIDRTVRTFDQVRDPSTFILDMEGAIDSLGANQQGLAGLAQMIQGAVQNPAPLGLPAPGTPVVQ